MWPHLPILSSVPSINVGIHTLERDDLSSGNQEAVWVEMRNDEYKKSLVGLMYRPPSYNHMAGQNIQEEIMELVRKVW